MRIALIFSLLLSVLAVIFALQNPQDVEVNLLFVETQGSAALILIITFAIGVVVGLLSALPSRIRDRRELRKLRKHAGSSGTSGLGSESSFSMPSSGTSGSSTSGSSRSKSS